MNDYEKEHLQLLRTANAECTLFLKRNNCFPLSVPDTIALYGSGARRTVKGGTGSGEVNSRFFVTVEKGLSDAGFNIATTGWLNRYDEVREKAKKDFHQSLKEKAKKEHTNIIMASMGAVQLEPEYQIPIDKKCETAVYVLARNSGEGSDRQVAPGDVLLTQTEIRDILLLQSLYPNFLLVLNVGGPVDLSPIAAQVDNILVLSQLGVETGAILADILLGNVNPSGKLTTTWAAAQDYCSEGTFGDLDETYYNEGIYVGYRYFDTAGKKPLFPFGFGLSYTCFRLGAAAVHADGQNLTVTVPVTNTGRFKGKEVVQLYVSCPQGKLDQPYQTLAGFAKTEELMPGETGQVSITFCMSDIASFDEEQSAWILEQGAYVLRIGNSSADTVPAAVVTLDAQAVVRRVASVCGDCGFTDWKPVQIPVTLPTDVPVICLNANVISTVDTDYNPEYPIDPMVQELKDSELAYLNIGAFNPRGGVASIIGEASTTVAGAAGETTGVLKDKGFPVLVMADGPAGIRIARQYYKDEKGCHAIGQSLPESMTEMLPGVVKMILSRTGRAPKGAQILEQYATAIPIGTAIAQSFNTDFARACGDLVGDEMERFGVHLWLAPALNIHRSILCGRNFEYYSEDPLVSGLMAAAITNGVQQHPGCGTTIKHYACNSQETNRYNSNSHVSQRALREIYLRGFGICVRNSQPKAVMTSYNLLNGVHTSESRDLAETVLRCEFGFRGIIMTDWVVSAMTGKAAKYASPDAGLVAAAGGDLFMPGGKGDYKNCLAALKSGKVTRQQLEINATRVLHMAQELTKE